MELLIIISILILPFVLPFIAYLIIANMPDKKAIKVKPVETEEIFDHLFIEKKQMIRSIAQTRKAA